MHAIITENSRVKAEDLCKLLDDHNKEEDAAKHLNMIFSSFEFDLTMDSFTRVVRKFLTLALCLRSNFLTTVTLIFTK